ncbi:hypothetical protein VNO77_03655 [Canavalia gladiata]|uniref:Uncharacterized protein n=1 Tax=Canavalia gladiata TaxID=3824 RepID=A0AAN9MV21_CANGL
MRGKHTARNVQGLELDVGSAGEWTWLIVAPTSPKFVLLCMANLKVRNDVTLITKLTILLLGHGLHVVVSKGALLTPAHQVVSNSEHHRDEPELDVLRFFELGLVTNGDPSSQSWHVPVHVILHNTTQGATGIKMLGTCGNTLTPYMRCCPDSYILHELLQAFSRRNLEFLQMQENSDSCKQ